MEVNEAQDEYVEEAVDLHKVRKIGENGRTLVPQPVEIKKVEGEMDKEAVIKQIGYSNWDDRLSFKRSKSGASCKIDDIESFVYGGFSSRFWLMRKHINSMETKQILDLPFYCWECITIQTSTKNINLVIRNQ